MKLLAKLICLLTWNEFSHVTKTFRETRRQSTTQNRGNDQQSKQDSQEEYTNDKAKEMTNGLLATHFILSFSYCNSTSYLDNYNV